MNDRHKGTTPAESSSVTTSFRHRKGSSIAKKLTLPNCHSNQGVGGVRLASVMSSKPQYMPIERRSPGGRQ